MIAAPAIRFDAVERVYPGACPVWALRGISLDVPAAAMTVIEGPSGSGKTTLLAIAGGLDRATRGRVWVHGAELTAMGSPELLRFRRERIGFVFQDFKLISLLTAEENVSLALELRGFRDARARARAALARFGLGGRANTRAGDLSGGEKQRVAVARALVGESPLILADEPTANLDGEAAEEIITVLRDLTRSSGATVLVVSHDPRVARRADIRIRLIDGKVARAIAEEETPCATV
jgi:putative ABC transport system ATP-binding protein